MGPRVPFAPALLTLSLHITLHIYFISSRLFILLYVICVMVNKAVKQTQRRAYTTAVKKSFHFKHKNIERKKFYLLYRLERFTGKYTTSKIHTKPHPFCHLFLSFLQETTRRQLKEGAHDRVVLLR